MLSIQENMENSKEILTKTYGKKEGANFIVCYLSWVHLQLLTLHKNRKNAEMYIGKLPFEFMMLLRTERDNYHPHAHWVAVLKKYWRHHASHLFQLIEDDLKMAEKKDGMNIEPLLPHLLPLLIIILLLGRPP